MDWPQHRVMTPPIRAPRGSTRCCKSWQQEAALRLLINSADPDVAEYGPELLASACAGKVARDWDAWRKTCDELRELGSDETLLVRGGAPVAVSHTGSHAPRAVILDSDPAAAWTYIGSQQYLARFYDQLGQAAADYFRGEFTGKLLLSCGMDAAGGAFVLAAALRGAVAVGIEFDAERAKRRVKSGYGDVVVNDLDEALRIAKNAARRSAPAAVALVGDCQQVLQQCARRGVVPDLLAVLASGDNQPACIDEIAMLRRLGTISFDAQGSATHESRMVRFVALSGELSDIRRIDQLILEKFSFDQDLCAWIKLVQRRLKHYGLPARACLLSTRQSGDLLPAIHNLVSRGELQAPVAVIGQTPATAAELAPLKQISKHGTPVIEDASVLAVATAIAKGASWVAVRNDGTVTRVYIADGTSQA